MKAPTAKALNLAAARARGSASIGGDFAAQALKNAAVDLATANAWLADTVPTLTQWDNPQYLLRVDAVQAAAADLAAALNLPAFKARGNDVFNTGYQG